MTLGEYDAHMHRVHQMRDEAHRLLAEAAIAEKAILEKAGLMFVVREPGFDCWAQRSMPGYHPTPREALAAWTKELARER